MKRLLTIFFILPVTCFAQIKITGKVIDAETKTSVASASVFLSNASVGNKTDNAGLFVLQNVKPGQYELVVSIVGYETYRQTIMTADKDITLPDIKITLKTTGLKEVNIRPDPNWANNYFTFKREFLGTSELAKQCRILNPEMVDLEYDKTTRVLSASSYDFLEIENLALGYKIKYLLSKFIKDNKENKVYFEGSALFENLKGSDKDKRRWQRNREKAYLGSPMHFLRAIIGNNLAGNKFEAMRLIRKPDPDYHGGLNQHKYIQTLVNAPLAIDDFVRLTDTKGLFALTFKDCLYVVYTQKNADRQDESVYRPLDMPNYPISILTFNEQYVVFDSNGVIANPASVTFEGAWGGNRMAEMLPVDYTPEPAK